MPTLRIIGPGRAGGAIATALADAGWELRPPLGRDDDVSAAAHGVDLLIIATPDAAIASVAAAIEPDAACVVAHLAGSLGLDVLAPHPRRAALHPLAALPNAEVGAQRLRGASYAVAGDPLVRTAVDALDGRAFEVADEDRAAYHAAAVIASNHLVALLGQVERVAATAGVPLDAYLDLVRATVDNVARARSRTSADRSRGTRRRRHHPAPPRRACARGATCVRGDGRRREAAPPVRMVDTVAEARAVLDDACRAGQRVGLVPTMGFLHDGHASLMRQARDECDLVIVTIFVNPLQFGPTEDLAAYPRDLDRDRDVVAQAGGDLLLVPSVEEMYPEPVLTTVTVADVSRPLEGERRPSHFAGVATVVAKLFNIVGPCHAYFGEKDFQQLAVVRKLVVDLSIPVTVVGCETVREPDGLAMSSRNVYLTPDERRAAPVVHRALLAGRAAIDSGERDPAAVRRTMQEAIAAEPLAELDYAEVVDAESFTTPDVLVGELRLLAAVRFGKARLIDNVGATAAPASTAGGH